MLRAKETVFLKVRRNHSVATVVLSRYNGIATNVTRTRKTIYAVRFRMDSALTNDRCTTVGNLQPYHRTINHRIVIRFCHGNTIIRNDNSIVHIVNILLLYYATRRTSVSSRLNVMNDATVHFFDDVDLRVRTLPRDHVTNSTKGRCVHEDASHYVVFRLRHRLTIAACDMFTAIDGRRITILIRCANRIGA